MDEKSTREILGRTLTEKDFELLCSRNRVTDTHVLRYTTPALLAFKLFGCTTIRRSVISCIMWRCPKLEVFEVQNTKSVVNKTVRYLLNECRALKVLNVNGCVRLSDSAFKVEPFRPLPGLAGLETLEISKCRQITSMSQIVKSCRNLKRLNLGRTSISEPTVAELLRSVDTLEYIDVSFIPVLDSTFQGIACPNIHTIVLERALITDVSAKYIRDGCPNLKHLKATWCPKIGTEFVKNLVGLELESLDLTGAPEITKDVTLYMNQISSLSTLSVCWCPKMSAKVLDLLRPMGNLKLSFCSFFQPTPGDRSYVTDTERLPKVTRRRHQSLDFSDAMTSSVDYTDPKFVENYFDKYPNPPVHPHALYVLKADGIGDVFSANILRRAAAHPLRTLAVRLKPSREDDWKSLGLLGHTVQHLRLDLSDLGAAETDMVVEQIKEFRKLKKLSLRFNNLVTTRVEDVIRLLRGRDGVTCETLHSLQLYNMPSEREDAADLESVLPCMEYLKTLVLSTSNFKDVDFLNISSSAPMLYSLSLVDCGQLTAQTARAMTEKPCVRQANIVCPGVSIRLNKTS